MRDLLHNPINFTSIDGVIVTEAELQEYGFFIFYNESSGRIYLFDGREFDINGTLYPMLTEKQVENFSSQILKTHKSYGSETPEPSYIPNMEEENSKHEGSLVIEEDNNQVSYPIEMSPLIKTTLAHLIYIKKANIDVNDFEEFNPNVERINHLSKVVESVSDLEFHSVQFVSFFPGNSPMQNSLIKTPIFEMITSKVLRDLLNVFIDDLAPKNKEIIDFVGSTSSHKKDPTRGLGVLYFMLLDCYLENVDTYFRPGVVKEKGVNFVIARSYNVCFLAFYEAKNYRRFKKEYPLSELLPAWGLSAKVRTAGTRGGRVLRPFNGKLFISVDGKLRWIRPEKVIQVNT